MIVSVFRKAHFNAAHRLNIGSWTKEKNEEVFGLCNNPNFHGHNYDLEVKVTGEVDPITGFLIDLSVLNQIIQKEVVQYMDHRNLNMEIDEFKTLNPTVEHICFVIYNRLRLKLNEKLQLVVRLYETQNNYAEYPAN